MARRIPVYICPAIEAKTCTSTSGCCPHRIPHQHVESCAPKACRFFPDGAKVACIIVPDPDAPASAVTTPPETLVETNAVIKVATSPDQAEKDDPEDEKDAD